MKHTTVIFIALFGAAKATDDDSAIHAASAPVDIQLRGAASSISKVDFWEDDVHKVYNDVEEVAVSTTEASNFVLLPGSTYSRCPAGREVSLGACLAAANELTAGLTTIPKTKRGTVYGTDWNWTPCGCFVYEDRVINFDTNCGNAVTQADSDLVCKQVASSNAESVRYENKKGANGNQGYCLPWDGAGGDLCEEDSTLPVCSGSDSSYYLPDKSQSQVALKCNSELRCKGYTWNTGNSKGKLKSKISSVEEWGGYQCYEKEDQCIEGEKDDLIPDMNDPFADCFDTYMLFFVDQWVSGTSDEDTGDRVDAHFYKGGVEQACIYNNGVGDTRGIYHRAFDDDVFIWPNRAGHCTAQIIADRVDLVIHGGDAMLIEHAILSASLGDVSERKWGTANNGYAWCMSTDKDDWKGDWESNVQEKTCFQKLSFRENGKVYGSHSISEPWVCISFCG